MGAVVVRQLTIAGVDKIQKYVYLKNGAMYSILFLGTIMILGSFGFPIPHWFSPIITFGVIGYFFLKSKTYSTDMPDAVISRTKSSTDAGLSR